MFSEVYMNDLYTKVGAAFIGSVALLTLVVTLVA